MRPVKLCQIHSSHLFPKVCRIACFCLMRLQHFLWIHSRLNIEHIHLKDKKNRGQKEPLLPYNPLSQNNSTLLGNWLGRPPLLLYFSLCQLWSLLCAMAFIFFSVACGNVYVYFKYMFLKVFLPVKGCIVLCIYI